MTLLITGGAGFIGSNLVQYALDHTADRLLVLDKLTYAGSLRNLDAPLKDPRVTFVQADIADRDAVARVFTEHRPTAVLNLAAETHVDRSIDGPRPFIDTNIVGTFVLLEAARTFVSGIEPIAANASLVSKLISVKEIKKRENFTQAPSGRGVSYFRFTTVSVTCDGYCPEWCTTLCATTPLLSS